MKRGQPLKADPAKTKAWQERSRKPLAKSRTYKAKVPKAVRAAAKRRSGGKCVWPGCGKRAVHCHHVLDESIWPELAKIEANLVGLCFDCHMTHTFSPNDRLPYEAIPDCTHRLAATLGPRAASFLERHYPSESRP